MLCRQLLNQLLLFGYKLLFSGVFRYGKIPGNAQHSRPLWGDVGIADRGVTTNRNNHKFATCSTFLCCGRRKTAVNIASGHPSASHTFGSSP